MLATLADSTASVMVLASVALRPRGFSHITILPAWAAAIAISAWVSLGLAMSIRSISGDSTRLRQSVTDDSNPHWAAKALARPEFGAQTVLRRGWWGRSKELFTLRNALA